MSLSSSTLDRLPSVQATLNYLKPMEQKPRTFTFEPPNGEPKSNVADDPRLCAIRDVRTVAREFDLDEHGFEFVSHPGSFVDFDDERLIRDMYYREAEDLLTSLTGADRVVVFDHTIRRRVSGASDRAQNAPRQPAARVHVDQTLKSGPQRVRHELPDEADDLLKGRVQIINLWRPIRVAAWDTPLAVCDTSTVQEKDFVASDLVFPDRVGETYSMVFNPAHRWLYYPGMSVNDVLLLRCYDSAAACNARFVPHGAFTDPTTPANAAPRESIELRTMVFHDA